MLEDAGIDRAIVFVAIMSGDVLNLMVRWFVKRCNVRILVLIVNQKEHPELSKEVGVRINENPTEIAVRSLCVWSV
jgi:Trk K+ transport system NAD-binding subunit